MPSLYTSSPPQSVAIDGISGPGGANRMTMVSGTANLMGLTTTPTVHTLQVLPELQVDQFRRATATVGLIGIGDFNVVAGTTPPPVAVELSAIDADFDDESGRVELRVTARGSGSAVISFQVITLAAIT